MGLAALYAANLLGEFLHRVLGQFNQPSELIGWCAGLAIVALLLAFTPRTARTRQRIERLASTLRRLGRILASAPAGVSLPFVVAASFAVHVGLNWSAAVPRVFSDELIYSGVGKSLAAGDGFDLRGVAVGLDYGLLYVASLGGVYELASDGASAYRTVQTLNALAMSLAAVPSYYLARRIVSQGWSLVVACLAVATPAMAYTALVMTEALFYPVFVTAGLALVLALERPTRARQALVVGLILVAAAVRIQALVFVPALLTAVFIEGVRARRPLTTSLRRFTITWALFAVVGVAALVVTQGDFRASLGAYRTLVREYPIDDIAKWLGWNLAALELSLGIVAFAALLVSVPLLLRRTASDAEGAFASAVVAVVFWTALSVALLSASPYGLDRLHWRNLFVVLPMVLACFAWWLAAGLPRSRLVTIAAAGVTLALPLLVPASLVTGYHLIDSPSTRPWAELTERAPSVDAWVLVAPFVALGVMTFLLARRPAFPLLSVVLAFVLIAATTDSISELPRSKAARFAWVDKTLPAHRQTLLVHFDFPEATCPRLGETSMQRELVRMTEFFNTSVTRFAYVWGRLSSNDAPSPALTIDPEGVLRNAGRKVYTSWAIADSRVTLAGSPLAQIDMRALDGPWSPSPTGSLTLWRIDAPLRVSEPKKLEGGALMRLACVPPDTVRRRPAA